MTGYVVKRVSCDGGVIGKTWEAEYFLSFDLANDHLHAIVERSNQRERDLKRHHAQFKKDTVERIEGFCNWQYGIMLYLEKIEIRT